jgi:uncharacterized membrane protein
MVILIAKKNNKAINMKKFLNNLLDWIMNLIFAVILFGGGAWVIYTIFIQ